MKTKTNVELRAALNMVLTRLDSDPKSVEEWTTIRSALANATSYAAKREAKLSSQKLSPPHPKGKCGNPHCSCASS